MTAETIARALGGRKVGTAWMARCPVHDDHEPSLSIKNAGDGKVLVRCHAGCDQQQVIAALKARGLWEENDRHHARSTRRQPCRIANEQRVRDDPKRLEAALRIRQETTLAIGTPLETYFQSRGIFIALPSTIRFHKGLRHPSGGVWPGMVALVTRANDDKPLGIHRTLLSRDGTGKAS